MPLSMRLSLLLAIAPLHVQSDKGPSEIPVDFRVGTTSGTIVQLSSLVDTSKAAVIHLVTDQCEVSTTNIKHLETKAAQFPDVQFISILAFVNMVTLKEFSCAKPAASNCEADSPVGATLAAEAGYVGSNLKVIFVQDMYKDEPLRSSSSSSSGGCKDKLSNCPEEKDKGNCDSWAGYCDLTCGVCQAEEVTTTAAPVSTVPLCRSTGYSCGAIFNQFGYDGTKQTIWDVKEQITTYAPGGCQLGYVPVAQNPAPDVTGKLWDGALKTKVDDAIAAVAAASSCSGGGSPSPPASPSPSPSGDSTTASPAPALAVASDAMATAPAFTALVVLALLAQP